MDTGFGVKLNSIDLGMPPALMSPLESASGCGAHTSGQSGTASGGTTLTRAVAKVTGPRATAIAPRTETSRFRPFHGILQPVISRP